MLKIKSKLTSKPQMLILDVINAHSAESKYFVCRRKMRSISKKMAMLRVFCTQKYV
jgi:hypothetical protein